MAGGGTEQSLQVHLQKYLDHVESGTPAPPRQMRLKGRDFGSGSPNHKGLRVVCDYVDNDTEEAKLRLDAFLTVQRERGLMCAAGAIETNTASHWQLHAAWAGVGLLVATERKSTLLIHALREWWWSAFALCAACEIPGAKDRDYPEPLVWGPGWRAKIKDQWVASNPARDLCYSLMMSAAHPTENGVSYRKRLPPRKRKLWRDKYNNGARALLLLKPEALAALLPPPGWVPPLPYPFHARRMEFGFAAWFDVPSSVKTDVARAAGAHNKGSWVEEHVPFGLEHTLGSAIDYPATSFERS